MYGGQPEKSWINQMLNNNTMWLLLDYSSNSKCAFYANNGRVITCAWWSSENKGVKETYSVYPVVYLNENIKISSGTGKVTDPYKIEL